jgi:hypothetical protein
MGDELRSDFGGDFQNEEIREDVEEGEDRSPFLGGDLATSGFTAMDEEVDPDGDSRRRRNEKVEGQAKLYSAYIEKMNADRAKRDFFYALMFNYAECKMDESLKEMIESVQNTYTKPKNRSTVDNKSSGTSFSGANVGAVSKGVIAHQGLTTNHITGDDCDDSEFIRDTFDAVLKMDPTKPDACLLKVFTAAVIIGREESVRESVREICKQDMIQNGYKKEEREAGEKLMKALVTKVEELTKQPWNTSNIDWVVREFVSWCGHKLIGLS